MRGLGSSDCVADVSTCVVDSNDLSDSKPDEDGTLEYDFWVGGFWLRDRASGKGNAFPEAPLIDGVVMIKFFFLDH